MFPDELLALGKVESSENGCNVASDLSSRRISFSEDLSFEFPALKEDETESMSDIRKEEKCTEFEFLMPTKGKKMEMAVPCVSMVSADELFRNGEIAPLLSYHELPCRHSSIRRPEENESTKATIRTTYDLHVKLAETSQLPTSSSSQCSTPSPVNVFRGLGGVLRRKLSSTSDRVFTDRPGRTCRNLYYRRSVSVGEAKSEKPTETAAQFMLQRTRSDSRASWCGSTSIIPGTVMNSNSTDLTRKSHVDVSSVVNVNDMKSFRLRNYPERPKSFCDMVVSAELASRICDESGYPPRRFPITILSMDYGPGTTKLLKPVAPRLDRELAGHGGRDHVKKAAIANNGKDCNDSRRFPVSRLCENGNVGRQTRPLRHYENRKNYEKAFAYQSNVQTVQVLHMNGCMGKSNLLPKFRFNERSSSDISKKKNACGRVIRNESVFT